MMTAPKTYEGCYSAHLSLTLELKGWGFPSQGEGALIFLHHKYDIKYCFQQVTCTLSGNHLPSLLDF